MSDPDCVCQGNWRLIVKEYAPLIGRRYRRDHDGRVFTFYGIVHSDDDYYYGMWSSESFERPEGVLLSCVSSIEGCGYTLVALSLELSK